MFFFPFLNEKQCGITSKLVDKRNMHLVVSENSVKEEGIILIKP